MDKYQLLDNKLARLLGLNFIWRLDGNTYIDWRHDRVPCQSFEGYLYNPSRNSKLVFELMCEYELDIVWMGDKMFRVENSEGAFGTTTYTVDHDGCKEAALKWAVVECVISLLENN